jgi:hypothetical protein
LTFQFKYPLTGYKIMLGFRKVQNFDCVTNKIIREKLYIRSNKTVFDK